MNGGRNFVVVILTNNSSFVFVRARTSDSKVSYLFMKPEKFKEWNLVNISVFSFTGISTYGAYAGK